MKVELLGCDINQFNDYMSGKIKLDHISQILVDDIENNRELLFKQKWIIFKNKFQNIESLNLSKLWNSLIEKDKLHYFNEDELPFNKHSYIIYYASKKYLLDNKNDEKKYNFLLKSFNELKIKSKGCIFKNIETLNTLSPWIVQSNDEKMNEHYFQSIIKIDELYRSLSPQNPDKFLTNIIISLGKETEIRSLNESTGSIIDVSNFQLITKPLIERLITFEGIGANKLNNKKPSQSLNQIYQIFNYFQKYYNYSKLDEKLIIDNDKKVSKKNKI